MKLLYVDAFAIFLDIRIHGRKRNKRKPWNSREKLGRENLIRNTLGDNIPGGQMKLATENKIKC